jgi:hypothetical protein
MNDHQIPNPNRNLDYQFYFLFRTWFWQNDQQICREPFDRFDKLQGLGIQIDTDKRLFLRPVTPGTLLSDWPAKLKNAWDGIVQKYARAFSRSADFQPWMAPAETYCQASLLGVALLILDESLERHSQQVSLDLVENQTSKLGTVSFQYDAQELFTIQDNQQRITRLITFHQFRPVLDGQKWKTDPWRLNFDKPSPYLSRIIPELSQTPATSSHAGKNLPLSQEATKNYPVLLVYGLAHGDALDEKGNIQPWVTDFSHFIQGGGSDSHPLRQTAILNTIMARLLISAAVFETIDAEASQWRQTLQRELSRAFAVSERELRAKYHLALEEDLREIDKVITYTLYLQGRMNQIITTLTTNQENLKRRLQSLASQQTSWQLDWQPLDGLPSPLLDYLGNQVINLRNHLAYLEGKLLQFQGARQRWVSYLSEQRHSLAEHLGHLGHIIIFLIALAKMGELLSHPPAHDQGWLAWLLNHPNTYLCIFLVYLMFFGSHLVKNGRKWLKYRFHQLFKRGTSHE